MTQLRQIVLTLAALAAITFLFLVGAGIVAVLALVVLAAMVWRRIRRMLVQERGTPHVQDRITDVEYEMVEERKPEDKP